MIYGKEYVEKGTDSGLPLAIEKDGMRAAIVRTYSAGVFYGYIKSRNGKEVVMSQSRRMWKWFGASLSELAEHGSPDISKCKFPIAIQEQELIEVIEIDYLTQKALDNLNKVSIWMA
jgi:hypothetical protein